MDVYCAGCDSWRCPQHALTCCSVRRRLLATRYICRHCVLSVDSDSPFLSCRQIGPGPWRRGKSYSFPLKRLSTPKLDSHPLQLLVKSWYVIHIYNKSFSVSFCLGWSTSRTSAYGYAKSEWVAVVSCSVPYSPSGSRNRPTTTTSSLPRFDCIFNQRGSTLSRYPLRWGYVLYLTSHGLTHTDHTDQTMTGVCANRFTAL